MALVKRALAQIAFILCAFGAAAAQADVQRWTFQDVVFKSYPNTLTGESMDGGTLRGFFLVDTDTGKLISWNIFTSPGWAFCNKPAEGNVCYVDGLHWTKGNSYVFEGAAFFVLLRGDQNTYPMLSLVTNRIDANTLALQLHNANEIFTDTPNTYRQFQSGVAVVGNGKK